MLHTIICTHTNEMSRNLTLEKSKIEKFTLLFVYGEAGCDGETGCDEEVGCGGEAGCAFISALRTRFTTGF
jgi:hypothetical protein